MKVWIYVEQAGDWDEVCSCERPINAFTVRTALERMYPTCHITEASEKPTQKPQGVPVQMARGRPP